MRYINRLIERSYPQGLLDLRLSGLRLSPSLLSEFVNNLSQNTSLIKLKLSEVNLGSCTNFDTFLNYVKNDQLRVLDLSWSGINGKKLCKLWFYLGEYVQ